MQPFDTNTALGILSLALVILVVTSLISRLLTYLLRRSVWTIGRLGRRVDATVIRNIVHFKTLILFLIAFVLFASHVPALRALVGTMAAGAGITALIVGFAAKSSLSNIVAGIAIAFYRPVRIGDQVTIEGEFGVVEDLTLRHTIVRTWEHKRLIIPNEKLDNMSIVNHTIIDPTVLARVEVGVSYDTNLDVARSVLQEVAEACPHRDPKGEPPTIRVIEHGASAIVMRVYLWVPDVDALWLARFWLFEEVKKRFDKRGIEIPFAYRTLVFKKDLPPPLQAAGEAEAGAPAAVTPVT